MNYSLNNQLIISFPNTNISEYIDKKDNIIDYIYIFKMY